MKNKIYLLIILLIPIIIVGGSILNNSINEKENLIVDNNYNKIGMTSLNSVIDIKGVVLTDTNSNEKTNDIPMTSKTRNILLYVGSILFVLAFSIFVIYDHKKRDYNS